MTIPVTVGSIPNQSSLPLAVYSLPTAPFFSDPDMGTKSWSATGLPSGITINSTTGLISGTSSTPGTYPVTVTVIASNGATHAIVFSLVVSGTAPGPGAAQTFYVNPNTGNDAWNGLAATGSGSPNGPWASLTRASQVQPHGSGHVDIMVAGGSTFRNDIWNPQFGGTNDTHRIRLRVNGAGKVRLLGPSSGSVNFVILIGVPWISILRESETQYFEVDGEVVFGGSGVAKGDDPTPSAHIKRGVQINSTDGVFELNVIRSPGNGTAVEVGTLADRNIYRCDFDQIGTPYNSDGADLGDGVAIHRSNPTAIRSVVDGGTTGRFMNRIGHTPGGIFAGSGCWRGISTNNSWATVPTFSASEPDGGRAACPSSQNGFDVHMYNCILQRNGMVQDGASSNQVELTKLEGTRNGIFDSVMRNGRMYAIISQAAEWSHHSRGCRVGHSVFDNIRGALLDASDWLQLGEPGITQLSDFVFKNIVIRNIVMNPRSGMTNMLGRINLSSNQTMAGSFPNGIMHGVTIQDATRDGDDFIFQITGADGPGNQTLTWWLANHSNLFSNFTFTTDCNLDNAPATSVDADITAINTQYLPVSDSLSIAQGVNLTTVASGDSGSGTSLIVNDATWFDNPIDGNPGFGPHSSGFFIHCNGANRQYTAINYVTKALTMSTGFSRSSGMAVNRKIASGNVPNRGIRAAN